MASFKFVQGDIRDNEPIYINGDCETSRYFCFTAKAVQANLLAAISKAFTLLGYVPIQRAREGLTLSMPWYVDQKMHEKVVDLVE